MSQRTVTMKGDALPLEGPELTVGQPMPDFELVDPDLNPLTLKDFAGQPLFLVVVPSLDTHVCNLQARRFDGEMAGLVGQVKAMTVSMDLPFAQRRWASAAGVSHLLFGSDHRQASFGMDYGLLIPPLRLLARSVLLADAEGTLRYMEVVSELTNEPDYAAAMAALRNLS